jgi:hypothetical protein
MGKYLKKFETQAAYTEAQSSLILPNVSFITENNKVAYNPYVDPYAGHEYVEIGGLKWATMNVGAESETDYGLYFQWGDTQGYTASQVGSGEGQKAFKMEDYKYGNGTSSPGDTGMTKYNATDGKTVLDLEDDAARANWGGVWRMPTTSELQSLENAVNAVWTTNHNGSGVNGLLCTDETDSTKTLFFPAGGCARIGSVSNVGDVGYVWSSSLNSGRVIEAWSLTSFSGGGTYWDDGNSRYYGFSVRGVVG